MANQKNNAGLKNIDESGVPGGSPIGDWSEGSQTATTSGSGTTVGSLKKSADDITGSSVGKTPNMGGKQGGKSYNNSRTRVGADGQSFDETEASSPTGYGYIYKSNRKEKVDD